MAPFLQRCAEAQQAEGVSAEDIHLRGGGQVRGPYPCPYSCPYP